MVAVFVSAMAAMLFSSFFFAAHRDAQTPGRNAVLRLGLPGKAHALEPEGVESGDGGGGLFDESEQRAGEHVARDAHRAVQVEDFHFAWFMRLASTPAPKPLSMFTVQTPAAHVLSIDSSAATPPNDAP